MDNPAFEHSIESVDRTNINVKSIDNLNIDDDNTQANTKNLNNSTKKKASFITKTILKFCLLIIMLYLFLLSLNFMSIGFTLVAGYAIKAAPTIKFILSNPFAALSIGIILTAILQNATAATSIAVSMVGAGIIPTVESAIPIIIGANIGTCVTNALIALTLAGDPLEFKRAFSGSTLNDMFNLLTTAIVMPIQVLTNFLDIISNKIVDVMPLNNAADIAGANFMSVILNPVCDLFILLDNDAIDRQSRGDNETKIALRCQKLTPISTLFNNSIDYIENFNSSDNVYFLNDIFQANVNGTEMNINNTICTKNPNYWMFPLLGSIGDGGIGAILIVVSIIVLIICLFGIVKVLSIIIVGPIAKGVRICINASFPGKFKWLSELLLFIFSFLITLIVQSSNIVTATLVPLCGIGIVTLQRVYVLTLGSNIGTTVTGILTAFTQPPNALKKSLQVAFVYTIFNVIGVVLWLPIPQLRFPKILAKKLGKIVFKYRWFLFLYVFSVYFFIPGIVFGLALIPDWIGLAIVGIPVIILVIVVILINIMQEKCPSILPNKLQDFLWLPLYLRSFKPLDKKIQSFSCYCCTKKFHSNASEENKKSDKFQIGDILRHVSVVESLVQNYDKYKSNGLKPVFDEDDSENETVCNDNVDNSKNTIYTIDYSNLTYL